MPLTFIDPTHIELTAYIESDVLRIDCEGTALPVADQVIVCEVSAGVVVPFALELEAADPSCTIEAGHLDRMGQLQLWSGSNPRWHGFGLTGGSVDVTVAASSSDQTKITIIKLEVKPKTDKPFRR